MDAAGCERWFRQVFILSINLNVPAGERVALLWDNFSGDKFTSILGTNIDIYGLYLNHVPIFCIDPYYFIL